MRELGLAVVVPAGLEADDVLASTAALVAPRGGRTVVVTSDRDAFALIDEHHLGAADHQRRGRRLAADDARAAGRCCSACGPSSTATSPPCAATPRTTCPASPASVRGSAARLLAEFRTARRPSPTSAGGGTGRAGVARRLAAPRPGRRGS